jgi:hypothetical protein
MQCGRRSGAAYVGIGLHAPGQARIAGDRCEFHYVGPSEPFAERLDQIIGRRNMASITLLDSDTYGLGDHSLWDHASPSTELIGYVLGARLLGQAAG